MEPNQHHEEQPEKEIARKQADEQSDAIDLDKKPNTPLGMAKEDLLDMTKGAAFMDTHQWNIAGVDGKSISGAGSGPGTGEISPDANRPTTAGTPAINDYVSPESLQEARDAAAEKPADDPAMKDNPDLPTQQLQHSTNPASGFPMGGVARNSEDSMPTGETSEQ
ncbi:hypothetical protein GXP67_14560 [Rhodocytophaga rosea]|uniref:Uncharacterized protein n=1 Tax=Rhodocytophaga rosea TaxID=2704465 RepID=A0A6C0GIH1_9BACT|nr:hypothetical protein [Rhodocytophaga rosea]QHT67769.1 hypothetical protein GXP67_14560 [Rhodocytophaga rosea]